MATHHEDMFSDYLGQQPHEATRGELIVGAIGLETSIDVLGQAFTIAPALTDAYHPAQTTVHVVGLPETDRGAAEASNRSKRTTIEQYGKYYTLLAEGNIVQGSSMMSGLSAKEQRAIIKEAQRQADGGSPVPVEAMRKSTRAIEEITALGIKRSAVLTPLRSLLRIAYGKEVGAGPVPVVSGIPERDMLLLVSPDELAAGVSEELFTERLRGRELIDLSKEALDARLENFLKVLQVEFNLFILQDTAKLGGLGRGRETRAISLFNRYKDRLGEDNLALKEALLRELGTTVQNFASTTTPRQYDHHFLQALSRQVFGHVGHILAFKQDFQSIYTAFGYEVPAIIAPPTPYVAPSALPQRIEKEAARPAVEQLDPSAIARFSKQLAALVPSVEQFNADWRLTAKKRTEQGLDAVVQALCRGTANAFGEQALAAMERGSAREAADILARIVGYSASGQSIAERLATAGSAQAELVQQVQALRQYAADNGIRPTSDSFPVPLQLTSHLQTVRNNWPAWRQLITDTWPQDRVASVQAIEYALFPEIAAAAQEARNYKIAIERLAQQKITRLNRIMLPPQPNDSTIRQALNDAGVTRLWRSETAWPRVLDLLSIRDAYDGELYSPEDIKDIRPGARLMGGAALYLFAEIQVEGDPITIAESPYLRAATFMVNQRLLGGASWVDFFATHYRRQMAAAGAVRIPHTASAPYGPKHLLKIHKGIEDLWLAANA